MAESSQEETLIEEKEDIIINPSSKKPSWRIAHFLKPSIPASEPPQYSPQTHLILNPKNPINPNVKSLLSKVNFHGWRAPLREWNSWVEKLLPSFESTWKKTSIYVPIMASTFEIPRCNDTIFALSERWCPETSSFALPWGEVTTTLEDVMVLGGYSVSGDPVLGSYNSEEMCEIEKSLDGVRREIMKTKAKKADQQQWMDIWMGKGGKFEHEAFLSLWLSRYVLTSDSVSTIHKGVFKIAVCLARGTKIALAPAVLARIYRDLRLLKEKIETFDVGNEGNLKKLNLWAPLQLLQMWVWERFPKLSPIPNVTITGQPRSARWHKVKILRINQVGLSIDSAKEGFKWRPYRSSLNNCSVLAKFYPETARWVSTSSSLDLHLESFARFIRVSYLVGLDCIERYLPHRVSMQFGFDQDIPGDFPELSNSSTESAWKYYNRPVRDVKLYMPSRFCEPGVTSRYLDWWKIGVGHLSKCSPSGSERMRIKLENNEPDVPPGFEPKGKSVRLELEGDEIDASTRYGSSEIKDVDAEDDFDDDDNLTLSQFRLKNHMNEANESDLSDNVCIRDEKNKGVIEPSEHTIRGFPVQHGKKDDCAIMIVNMGIDLSNRIARLQRIVDMIKMAQSRRHS